VPPIWPAAVSERSVAALAAGPGPATVLAAFPSALYLLIDGTVLPVVARSGLRLPTALWLAGHETIVGWGVQPGDEVVVGAGEVRLPGAVVRGVRTWRPRRMPAAAGPVTLPTGTRVSHAWSEPARRLTAALEHQAPVQTMVAAMVGAGAGLTPSGDDVLCGVLLGLRLRGRAAHIDRLRSLLRPRLSATTSLSAALLAEAAQGYAVPPVVRLGDALAAGRDPTARLAARDVALVGHSSGVDLLAGLGGCLDVVACPVTTPASTRGAAG
jgi:hypothetical protein